MVIRTPGGALSRNRAPGATAHPACSSRATAPVSSGTGTQTFMPLRPCAGTPRSASAAISASRRRRVRRGHHGGVDRPALPEPHHGPLEQPADPAGAQPLAALHPVDGDGIAGEHGKPQVGPVRLGGRAHQGPAVGHSGERVQRQVDDAVAVARPR